MKITDTFYVYFKESCIGVYFYMSDGSSSYSTGAYCFIGLEKMATAIPPTLDGGLRLTKRKFCFIIAAVGMVQPEFTPVELVGYKDNEAGSPLTLDNG